MPPLIHVLVTQKRSLGYGAQYSELPVVGFDSTYWLSLTRGPQTPTDLVTAQEQLLRTLIPSKPVANLHGKIM